MKERYRTGTSTTKADPGPSKPGNGVQDFGDTELMERHQHGEDPVGPAKIIKTDD